MKARLKLYLQGDGREGVFGDGRWRLLKAIDEEGSISRAAARLDRGYRKAWGDIKQAEQALGRVLVRKARGGPSGGRTTLTPFGRHLVEGWERCRDDVERCMRESFVRHLGDIMKGEDDET